MSKRNEERTFSYHRTSPILKAFTLGLVGVIAVEGSLGLFLILYLVNSLMVKLVCAVPLGLVLAIGIVSSLSLLTTHHAITSKGVVFRQGNRFNTLVFSGNLLKAERSPQRLSGMPVELKYIRESRLLQVTTGESSLVVVTLAKPQSLKPGLFRKSVPVERILVNVDEPDEFVEAINNLAGSHRASGAAESQVESADGTLLQRQPIRTDGYAIQTIDLCRTYGNTVAVDRLNLKVQQGEIFGFLGPNGAGKTTTINMLVGLLQPTEGKAVVQGVDVWEEPIRAKTVIGYVPDIPIVYERLTGREFLMFMAELYDARPSVDARIAELLDTLDLADWGDQMIKVYSHGMRRKIAIAAALVHQPQVLLLDEPTNGLDPRGARRVKDLLRGLASQGTTVFMSTHVMEIAERMCDRVGIIRKGKLVATGTMDELRQQTSMAGADLENIFLSLTGEESDMRVLSEL
jgi:ABC-2 type transport system ATP-binding protein